MNQQNDIPLPSVDRAATPALLYEMMRSFTVLARTLNLTQAVEALGSTRQTVRRHITQLETAMGGKLFEIEHRRYGLTEAGTRALAPAQRLLDQGEVWYSGNFDDVGGMMRFTYDSGAGMQYLQQEVPMSAVWSGRSDLLRTAVKAWTQAEGMLEAPAMDIVRPYVMGYREISDGWICVEVGERSFYSSFFGWAQARSSLGRNLNQFPGGEAIATLANAPFREITANAAVRLDQVMTRTRFSPEAPLETVIFDRLLFGVRLPDQSPAIISVVDRPCEVRIEGVPQSALKEVPDKARVDFEVPV
ncbi:LysR family transcriptional regulator [Sulfitobacter albidus]|uniref:LysR family transcriptional regulator n=1 Tax=Sulfitobacter albidus TaxID=2829501 RepID=A0A975JCI4_9RHOB|nr:LysR family transcriptional regulator [Sulfitobacter albidus]QUJ75745.1 LysR family transcriptional regulator [Sulfitobacter albidus]